MSPSPVEDVEALEDMEAPEDTEAVEGTVAGLDIVEDIVAGIEAEDRSFVVVESSFVAVVDSNLVAEGKGEPVVAVVPRGMYPPVALAY